jgi:hypothetical protein
MSIINKTKPSEEATRIQWGEGEAAREIAELVKKKREIQLRLDFLREQDSRESNTRALLRNAAMQGRAALQPFIDSGVSEEDAIEALTWVERDRQRRVAARTARRAVSK